MWTNRMIQLEEIVLTGSIRSVPNSVEQSKILFFFSFRKLLRSSRFVVISHTRNGGACSNEIGLPVRRSCTKSNSKILLQTPCYFLNQSVHGSKPLLLAIPRSTVKTCVVPTYKPTRALVCRFTEDILSGHA